MAAKTERVLIRVEPEWAAKLDSARGAVSRSEYMRAATEATFDGAGVQPAKGKPAKRKRSPRKQEEYELPKIAKAHWKP